MNDYTNVKIRKSLNDSKLFYERNCKKYIINAKVFIN